MVSGRRHHRLRLLVNHFMCRDGRSKESLMEQRTVKTLAARQNHPTALGTPLEFGKERALHLVEDVDVEGALVPCSSDCYCPGCSASPCFTASCGRDGSLAVSQPLWVQQTAKVPSSTEGAAKAHTCTHQKSNYYTSMGRHGNTTHPSQSSSCGSVHPSCCG